MGDSTRYRGLLTLTVLLLSGRGFSGSSGHRGAETLPDSSGIRSDAPKQDPHASICRQIDKAFVDKSPIESSANRDEPWYSSIKSMLLSYPGSLRSLEGCTYEKNKSLNLVLHPQDIVREAIMADDQEVVDRFLKDYRPAELDPPNTRDRFKGGLLSFAIQAGTPQMVKHLVAKGADKDYSSEDSAPAIHAAVEKALYATPSGVPWNLKTSFEILNLFSDKKTLAIPYKSGRAETGDLPLYNALMSTDAPNQLVILKYLIEKGAPVDNVRISRGKPQSALSVMRDLSSTDLRNLEMQSAKYDGTPAKDVRDAFRTLDPNDQAQAVRTAKVCTLLQRHGAKIPQWWGEGWMDEQKVLAVEH